MSKTFFSLVFICFFTKVFFSGYFVSAQNVPSLNFGGNHSESLQGLYGFDSPMRGKINQYQLSGRIVADPDFENRAFAMVQMTVIHGWHVFSVTQKDGASMPTKIQLEKNTQFRQIGNFSPTTKHIIKKNEIFETSEEQHHGAVTWIAPIEILSGSREQLEIQAAFIGQICDDEAKIGCIPINKSDLTLRFEKQDAASEIAAARQIAEELQIRWSGVDKTQNVNDGKNISSAKNAFSINELQVVEASEIQSGWLRQLAIAFLGGLILNIMPCVLPVISLKILSFFEQAGKSRGYAFLLNLWYVFGILFVFLILGILSQGLSVMFKYSYFSVGLCCVMFALALSMMDVWEIRMPSFLGSSKSMQLMSREGFFGAFFKGIITTLLAIPCSAPFLASALVWTQQETAKGNRSIAVMIYLVIGLGMASPYLFIGAFPELIRFLPKPGMWMDSFKKIMGFAMLSVVVWILYYLPIPLAVPTTLLLFVVWFACWYIGKTPLAAKPAERIRVWSVSLIAIFAAIILSFPTIFSETLQGAMQTKLEKWCERNAERLAQKKHWSNFTPEKLEKNLTAGKPVIVDFTADWCLTCKFLERNVLHDKTLLKQIDKKGIVALQADWTDGNEEITQLLRQLGSEQIPVVAVFDPKEPNKPIVLRGVFRTATLLESIDKFYVK
ncbi:MAG: thioredoxin family protein [Planctomycetaceae bacterium]|jgi:thiol:disulfide interchange protein DsbD|nr:thioredoxin family protein [Planctomycetaceae bacterium]